MGGTIAGEIIIAIIINGRQNIILQSYISVAQLFLTTHQSRAYVIKSISDKCTAIRGLRNADRQQLL